MKNFYKHLLMLSLFLLVSIGASATVYSGSCGSNAKWSLDTSTGLLSITGSGDMANYSSSSAPWYNYRSNIKSLSIGDQIISIGNYAFYNCSGLTSVTIPNSVKTIGNHAFFSCSGLTSVTIPNSVTEIGGSAFYGCSGMTSVTIPNSVTSIGHQTFNYCRSLSSIVVKSGNAKYDSRNNCNAIIETATNTLIAGSNNTKIPNNVVRITSTAFQGSGVASVEIPASVTTIELGAFKQCESLTNIVVSSGNTKYDSRNNCNAIIETTTNTLITGCINTTIPNSVTSIGSYAFDGCIFSKIVTESGSAKSVISNDNVVPESKTDVMVADLKRMNVFNSKDSVMVISFKNNPNSLAKKSAFAGSSSATLIIPNSVTSIGADAFWNCYRLTSVELSNQVTSIGGSAFEYCYDLTSVTIGNSVTSIGNYAFDDCSSLTSITVEAITPPSIEKDTFDDFQKPTLYVPASALGAYKAHQYWGQFKNIQAIQGADIPNDEIWYTSSDGKVVTPYDSKVFGASIVSNTYTNGKGIIKFNGNVTSIGERAFYICSNLTSVTIPNSVTSIGKWAFDYCSGLTSVTIPKSMTSIESSAFSDCSGLTSIKVESGNTVYDSRGNCNAIIETASNTLISGCKNTTIPNSVTSIDNWAFYGCSGLTSVTIPNSVTKIGSFAFHGCSGLTSIAVESGNTVYDSRGNCNAIIETRSNTLVRGCINTTIPNSVTSIGDFAFNYCAGLTSVIIPNSVTKIGSYAFQSCSSLTSVTIPYFVTSIGSYAFYGCSGLTSITVEAVTPPSIEKGTFDDFQKPTLYVPASALGAYKAHQYWGLFKNIQAIQGADIPNDEIWYTSSDGKVVTPRKSDVFGANIVSNTYTNGKGIIKFDGNVTSIGRSAFYGCSGLTSVTIPNSVTSIGDDAFYECSGLTSVAIPNSVTSIGDWAFFICSGLTSVTIPNSVTSIGDYAFYVCSGLTSVTIPNSVTSIGNRAFSSCSGLTSIAVESGNKVYDSRGNCNAIIETARNTLISGCKNTIIPNSVTSIGAGAFYGCSGLTSVTIHNSVTSIEGSAFRDCSGLTSVTIPNSVTSIGSDAFYGCSGLTSITVEAITPPSIEKGTFNNFEKPTLYVPGSALGAYKAHQYWGQFKNIQAIQGGDPSGTAHSWRVSNRTDIAVDFASINEADASSLVADGDTLYLERGTSLDTQTFKKRLVIVGPGYKYDKTGQDALVGYLYAYGEGSTIIGVNVTGYLYAYANNLTISHCRLKGVIGYKTSYENANCKIHSCFIDGYISGDGEDNSDAWVLTNNIFAEGFIRDLDNAVLDHNTFVVSNADFCLTRVTNSVVKNDILFHKRGNNPLLDCTGNTYEKNIFSMDQKLDNNQWCETLEKIITCAGQSSAEAYYQTFKGGYAYQYSTDGSDCGAFGGKEPYVMHGYTDLYVESEEGGGGDEPGFQIEPNDLLALKNLYNRYGGSKWYSGWTFKDKGVEAEDFPGVVFTTNTDSYGYHYVQEINLSKNNLSGDVSSWALSFPRLTSLNLSSNNLTGDLTGFVAELSNLKTLNVGYNMLTGLTSLPKSVATLYKDHQMANQYNTEYYANLEPVQVLISDEAVKTVLPTIFTYNLKSNSTEPVAAEMLYEAGNSGNFGRIEPTGNGYKTTWTSIPYFYEEEQDRSICLRSNDGSLYPAILSYVNGDADMSGFTNVLDVQNTINYILNPALLERFNSSAANTYSDKMVNVQDIVCTVNIILGLPNSPSARMKMSGYDLSSTANSLYTQGERVWLNVDSETAALDVVLKGVSTDEVSLMLNHNDFQMIARNTEEGSRYVIYSLTGKTIPVGTTAILRTSCDEAEPTDALLSTIDAKSIPVAVGMSPTGIAKVNTDNAIVRIYTIKGMEVYNNPVAISDSQLNEVKKNLENGIYIVDKQMKNGSHRKYKYLKQ